MQARLQPIRSELLWHKFRSVLCMPGMWLRVHVGFLQGKA